MRILIALLASIATLATPFAAHAWGPTGHRMVGEIAQSRVSGKTAAEIALILEPGETLAEASTWPDEQRSDPDEFWQKTSPPWHYVTVKSGPVWTERDVPPQGDAMSALTRFTATLRDPEASREDKATALRFVVHLVGDLHQPLHNGRGDDRGGNQFEVEWFGKSSNLHSVWDSGLLDGNGLSYTEYADRLERHLTPAETIAWWDPKPTDWIAESIELREQIYPADEQRSLGYLYQWTWRPAAERRVAQAGIRLAAYLDDIFAK